MANYQKPILELVDEINEGIYCASGSHGVNVSKTLQDEFFINNTTKYLKRYWVNVTFIDNNYTNDWSFILKVKDGIPLEVKTDYNNLVSTTIVGNTISVMPTTQASMKNSSSLDFVIDVICENNTNFTLE